MGTRCLSFLGLGDFENRTECAFRCDVRPTKARGLIFLAKGGALPAQEGLVKKIYLKAQPGKKVENQKRCAIYPL